MEDERDEIPTMMIVTPDNYLVRVGEPQSMIEDPEIIEYLKKGYTVKTVPFKEYRLSGIKWIYDKPTPAPETTKEP